MKKKLKQLNDALYKKALGYTVEEVSEEYNLVDNEMILSKRKLNKKVYPPDLSALQLLLEGEKEECKEFENFSLEQLKTERERLKNLLNKKEKEGMQGVKTENEI